MRLRADLTPWVCSPRPLTPSNSFHKSYWLLGVDLWAELARLPASFVRDYYLYMGYFYPSQLLAFSRLQLAE